MQVDLGCPVFCSDGAGGRLADVVIDPAVRRVTHLVVEPERHHALARLVPVELLREPDETPGSLALGCTERELRQCEPVAEFACVRLGELPVEEEEGWDIGPDLPTYVSYDRVPTGEVELGKTSAVSSAEGRGLGHLGGLVLDPDGRITGLVLAHGRPWARRRTTVPVEAVARFAPDVVTLSLTREDVRALGLRP